MSLVLLSPRGPRSTSMVSRKLKIVLIYWKTMWPGGISDLARVLVCWPNFKHTDFLEIFVVVIGSCGVVCYWGSIQVIMSAVKQWLTLQVLLLMKCMTVVSAMKRWIDCVCVCVCVNSPNNCSKKEQQQRQNPIIVICSCCMCAVFPVFIKKPVDITVKAGQSAKLQCSATGQPQPVVISWHKDGGDDFPAARERRMYVIPKDDQFFIASTRSSDEGVYTCRAENEAGVITANATVTILGEWNFVISTGFFKGVFHPPYPSLPPFWQLHSTVKEWKFRRNCWLGNCTYGCHQLFWSKQGVSSSCVERLTETGEKWNNRFSMAKIL